MNQALCSLFYNRNKKLTETRTHEKWLRFLTWTEYLANSQMVSYRFCPQTADIVKQNK